VNGKFDETHIKEIIMPRIFTILALSTALALPAVSASADWVRESSPARSMLRQLMAVTPVPEHRHERHHDRLAGDYRPTAVRGRRGVLRPLDHAADAWLSIGREGALSLSVGCNRYWTRIERHRFGALSVQPVIGTRMACGRRDARRERAMVNALRDTVRADFRQGRVVFLDRWGEVVLELAPSAFGFGANGWHDRADRW